MINKTLYDNSANFIYDDTKIQVYGNKASLKPTTIPGTSYIYCKLDEAHGLAAIDSSGNSRCGAFYNLNVDAWTSGKINGGLRFNGSGFINFDGYGDFDRDTQFSVEFWIKYSDLTQQKIVSKQRNTVVNFGWAAQITNGKIRFLLISDANDNITKETNNTYNDNSWHHVVCTYNGTRDANGINIFVDGVSNNMIVSNSTLSSTIRNSVNLQVSGRDGSNQPLLSTTYLDEFVMYERVLTLADVTYRYNSSNGTQLLPAASISYDTNNPSIIQKIGVDLKNFSIITSVTEETGMDSIRYCINVNSIDKFWNGSAWVNSSGYSQTNTLTEINNNKNSLITQRCAVKLRVFLHSDSGVTTPNISDLSTVYDINYDSPNLNLNKIYSTIFDIDGNPKSGVIIQVRDKYVYGTNSIITDNIISTITNEKGYFEISLCIENVAPAELLWQIGDKNVKTNFLSGIRKFSELTVLT